LPGTPLPYHHAGGVALQGNEQLHIVILGHRRAIEAPTIAQTKSRSASNSVCDC
jgi:hypothetical protein